MALECGECEARFDEDNDRSEHRRESHAALCTRLPHARCRFCRELCPTAFDFYDHAMESHGLACARLIDRVARRLHYEIEAPLWLLRAGWHSGVEETPFVTADLESIAAVNDSIMDRMGVAAAEEEDEEEIEMVLGIPNEGEWSHAGERMGAEEAGEVVEERGEEEEDDSDRDSDIEWIDGAVRTAILPQRVRAGAAAVKSEERSEAQAVGRKRPATQSPPPCKGCRRCEDDSSDAAAAGSQPLLQPVAQSLPLASSNDASPQLSSNRLSSAPSPSAAVLATPAAKPRLLGLQQQQLLRGQQPQQQPFDLFAVSPMTLRAPPRRLAMRCKAERGEPHEPVAAAGQSVQPPPKLTPREPAQSVRTTLPVLQPPHEPPVQQADSTTQPVQPQTAPLEQVQQAESTTPQVQPVQQPPPLTTVPPLSSTEFHALFSQFMLWQQQQQIQPTTETVNGSAEVAAEAPVLPAAPPTPAEAAAATTATSTTTTAIDDCGIDVQMLLALRDQLAAKSPADRRAILDFLGGICFAEESNEEQAQQGDETGAAVSALLASAALKEHREFWRGRTKAAACPACGEVIIRTEQARRAHYRSHHYAIYYSVTGSNKSGLDRWIRTKTGTENEGEWRACAHCTDGTGAVGRSRLVAHLKKMHGGVYASLALQYAELFKSGVTLSNPSLAEVFA